MKTEQQQQTKKKNKNKLFIFPDFFSTVYVKQCCQLLAFFPKNLISFFF